MGVVSTFLLAPLVSLRNLKLLAPMSTAAVVVAGLFVSSVIALGSIAAFEGRLGDFHVLPTLDTLGDTPSRIAISILAVLPVITMSFVCHYNLLPVARNLQRFTDRRIGMVIRRALSICTVLFTAVAGGGVLLFGTGTRDNILLNLNPDAISRYIPEASATVLCFMIRVGYCMCLMSTFAMLNWALRETVTMTLFGVEMLHGGGFLIVSWGILAAVYAVSILFPSVWTAMSLTGATAAVFVAYILPGALVAKVPESSLKDRVLGGLCIGLGLLMGVVGVLDTLVLDKV